MAQEDQVIIILFMLKVAMTLYCSLHLLPNLAVYDRAMLFSLHACQLYYTWLFGRDQSIGSSPVATCAHSIPGGHFTSSALARTHTD